MWCKEHEKESLVGWEAIICLKFPLALSCFLNQSFSQSSGTWLIFMVHKKILKHDRNMALKSHGIAIFPWNKLKNKTTQDEETFIIQCISLLDLLTEGRLFCMVWKVSWPVNCQHWHNSRLLWGWMQGLMVRQVLPILLLLPDSAIWLLLEVCISGRARIYF